MLHPITDQIFTLLTPERLRPEPLPDRLVTFRSVAKLTAAQKIVYNAHTATF